MRKTTVDTWVLYRMAVKGQPAGVAAVCEQRAWDEMQAGGLCLHTLVESGFRTEEEAEREARAGAVYTKYKRSGSDRRPRTTDRGLVRPATTV